MTGQITFQLKERQQTKNSFYNTDRNLENLIFSQNWSGQNWDLDPCDRCPDLTVGGI